MGPRGSSQGHIFSGQVVFYFVFAARDTYPKSQPCAFQVGSRLIEMLIDTAYIQPPVDQLADGPPDIRPAFRHYLKTVTKEQQ